MTSRSSEKALDTWFESTMNASRRSVARLRGGIPSPVVKGIESRLVDADRSHDMFSLISVSAALALLERSLKGDAESEREAMERLGMSIQTVS